MKTLPIQTLKEIIVEGNTKTVLFIDTCIFLDIVRSPIRENINNTEVESAINILRIVEKPNPAIMIVINETIKDEWESNIESTIEELKKEIKKTTATYKNIIDVYKFIVPSSNFYFTNCII